MKSKIDKKIYKISTIPSFSEASQNRRNGCQHW